MVYAVAGFILTKQLDDFLFDDVDLMLHDFDYSRIILLNIIST